MMEQVQVLDHGYLKYIEHYGSDERIIEAARMSTGKGFLGWEPGKCPTCEGDGTFFVGEGYPDSVCSDCNGTGKVPGDLGLLRRLWVKKHATPFEMAGMIVEVAAPIMVFREWHRHRTQSYNEMSGRYVPLPDVNYVPSVERVMVNSKTNKQAGVIKGADELTETDAHEYRGELRAMWNLQEEFYQKWLKRGVPKELARSHIGVGRYSRMRASANLRNWLAFLTLRMAEDAQWEIRQYANALCEFLKVPFPRTMSLYLEGK